MSTISLLLIFFLQMFSTKVLSVDPNDHHVKFERRNLNLDDLGAQISRTVHENLRPVREMEFRFRMKLGKQGTTVATFPDRQYIFREGVMYECDGTIVETDGSCSGTLRKPAFGRKEDFCYATVSAVVDNWYCITTGGGVNFVYSNGKGKCESTDGRPTLLVSAKDYKALCESRAYPVTYKYFTEELDDHGSDVHCSDERPYVCTLTEEENSSLMRSTGSTFEKYSFILLATLLHMLFLRIVFV
ncbi:uncharacterized protein LOC135138028 [Zophobas morio]